MALLATLLAMCGLLGFTWWLLAHYKDANVPTVVHAAVFTSWALGFLGLLLLPMDLATNGLIASPQSASDIAQEKTVFQEYLTGWRLLYWTTFLMSWVGLPFLVEFRQNGEFELDKRVLSSFKRLVFHWTVLAGGLFVVALYLILVDHLSLYGVLGLAMAASNTYGLLWVIALLGYGLVEIPRGFWMRRLDGAQLQKLYFQAVQLQDERMEARFEYDDVVADVRDAYQRMMQAESDAIILTGEMQYAKTRLLQVLALVEKSKPAFSSLDASTDVKRGNTSASFTDVSNKKRRGQSRASRKAPTLPETVELHRSVRIAQLETRRCDQAFLELCINVDVLHDRSAERALPAGSLYPETSALNRLHNIFLDTRHQLRRWVTSPVAIACAAVTGFLSLCVAWGELTMGWHGSSLSLFRFLMTAEAEETNSSLRSATELISALVLVYLALCCYTSLFTLRLPGKYTLRAYGNSTELCLLKTSIHQCRLQFALGQNALLLLRGGGLAEGTAFNALLANTRVVHVFGRGFAVYAPLAMIALAVFTLTNGYARAMRRLGIDQYEQMIVGDPSHAAAIAEGERLVQQGLERFRVLISRKKKIYETGNAGGGSYGFASAAAGTQSLLADDDDQEIPQPNTSEGAV
ncbi:LMBR1 domain-containing protein 2 [Phytophthora pseudosyringae]|uniref:LMBR1 domain-containing protein 2 n=1 Tax=Phytophthora pseudosyringae TaxID=221518 RepID=A0A8T1VWQ5_9STRA|nr:LMBR1 domain-containing protein 2 [Phytophthora pseudosyringae]